jgi:nucleoside-diphosphate-sugar epimerase
MIEQNNVPYINVDHSRDFIHVYDLVCAIKKVMKSNISGVIDVGTGFSINLNDLMSYLGLKVKKRLGKYYERRDNVADINILKELGWNPKYKLFDYLRKQNDRP